MHQHKSLSILIALGEQQAATVIQCNGFLMGAAEGPTDLEDKFFHRHGQQAIDKNAGILMTAMKIFQNPNNALFNM